ncbi:dTMP kinase [Mycoplasma corogypsi]|uniref:dTMP kinase n=1 Tax=Mycoplasma corogypsi TaxID=2106 RepID=UPI00387307DF
MFITFEGLDGSGKTTIINMIVNQISIDFPHLKHIFTREPGGKDLKEAERIREIILDPESDLSSIAEAFLYTTSRRIHLEKVVWPALNENKIVFCDRYVDSFYAYQGFARGLGLDYVKAITNLAIDNTMPEITVFFDITPSESRTRIQKSRLIEDRLEKEKEDFHNKVYLGYKEIIISEPNRFIVVNARNEIDQVFQEVYSKLLQHPNFINYLNKFKND